MTRSLPQEFASTLDDRHGDGSAVFLREGHRRVSSYGMTAVNVRLGIPRGCSKSLKIKSSSLPNIGTQTILENALIVHKIAQTTTQLGYYFEV